MLLALYRGGCNFYRCGAGRSGATVPAPWDKAAHFLYYGTMALLLAHGVGRRWLWIPPGFLAAIRPGWIGWRMGWARSRSSPLIGGRQEKR